MTLEELQNRCEAFIAGTDAADAAHDLHHTRRVVRNAVQLTAEEEADPQITLPAAWLHDCVAVAKDSPHRAKGSLLAAEAATTFLAEMHYPEAKLPEVFHAIEAHSFSDAPVYSHHTLQFEPAAEAVLVRQVSGNHDENMANPAVAERLRAHLPGVEPVDTILLVDPGTGRRAEDGQAFLPHQGRL